MSDNNENYKKYIIDNNKQALIVLQSLIIGVILNIEKFKEYASEAKDLLIQTNSDLIDEKKYDDIKDKLLFRQHQLLMLIADEQKTSYSYKNLRKILERKNYVKSKLSEEVRIILNDFLDIRNWSFHNTQSMLVADREVAEKNIPNYLKGIVKIEPLINPIIINKIINYRIDVLKSLIIWTEKRIVQFEKILNNMKNDYQEMFDDLDNKPILISENGLQCRVEYIFSERTGCLTDGVSDKIQISIAIQKKDYDGSDEKFEKWVLRNKQEDK